MTRARVRHLSLAAAAALLLAVLSWPPPARAEDGPPQRVVLDATPLVLKDGRMAYVSIHTVPFAPGADAPAPAAAGTLTALAAGLATDCFLTAQAIGHVEPGAKGEGDDTIASHRLARARADRVQRLLGEKGLPASAVASVWDYQFLVREPRVTLWVFRLREGEDCQGDPLPAGKSPLVAAAERKATGRKDQPSLPAPAAGPSPDRKAAPETSTEDESRAEAAPPSPVVAANDGPPPAERAATTPIPAPSPQPSRDEAKPAQATAPGASPPPSAAASVRGDTGAAAVARATEEVSSPPLAAAGPALAVVGESPPAAPPPRAAKTGKPAVGTAEIVFDKNSSFLPSGAGKELGRLVAGLPKAKGYEIRLAATVGGADAKASSPAEAARYDRWLAERRLSRVAEWLEKHAPVRELSLKRDLVENDPSRRVAIRVHPLP